MHSHVTTKPKALTTENTARPSRNQNATSEAESFAASHTNSSRRANISIVSSTECSSVLPCVLCSYGVDFHYAAASACDFSFDSHLSGRNLSLDDRSREAGRARRHLPDERIATHVWIGTRWSLHGAACGDRLGADRLGIISPAQLGALDDSGCDGPGRCVVCAQDFAGGIRRAVAVVRIADCAARSGSLVSSSVGCGD